jgi:hypothetical protein
MSGSAVVGCMSVSVSRPNNRVWTPRPLKLISKDFPVVSTAGGVLVRSPAGIRLSEKDRLRDSNRPLVSA